MKSHRFLLAAAAAIVFGGASHGLASVGLDWTIVSFPILKPEPPVGGPVTVGCAWAAKVTSSWKFTPETTDEVVLISQVYVWDVATNGHVDYYVWNDDTLYPYNAKSYTPGTTADFDGLREYTANLSAGLHKASCRIDGTGGWDTQYDDYKEITFDVKVPTLGVPPEGGTVMVTTPALPPFRRPPPVPRITPVITPPSPYRGDTLPAASALPAEGRVHKLRASERLSLVDGRTLTIQGTSLVLLDARGKVLRLFPPGVVVRIDSAREVSIQSGPLNVPLGVAKRDVSP